MAVTKDKSAPYAPASAILDVIERYRNRGLPSPVNSEVLGRAGIADSLIARTLQALQTLDLIDGDGKPTDTLDGLRLAPEAEYKERLVDWLNGVYADVIAFVDPAKDDDVKVRDAFRSYQPAAQQPRMVTLFLGLCAAAGLAPEKSSQPRRPRTANQLPPKRKPPKKLAKSGSPDIPPPLAGLLSSLPPEGQGWTQGQRNKFLTTFGAVLDFCFPTLENEAPQRDNKEEADQ